MVAACAGSGGLYEPIVDSPKAVKYTDDLSSCQPLSDEREYINGDVKSQLLAGAEVGAIAGSIAGLESAVVGAIVASAARDGSRALEEYNETKSIVIKCVKGRGHNVVG